MNLITGNRFKEFCKYEYCNSDYLGVQHHNGSLETVFCETHNLRPFMRDIRNYPKDVILVSHNSAGCILPYQFRKFDFYFQEHLIPENIVGWYAQNMDVLSDRIRPIPIGIENYKWHKGTKWDEIESMQKINIKRDKWLYLNVEVSTNPVARNQCINALKNKGFVTHATRVPFLQYLTEMKQHRFVVCPEGNGFDCHRTWESLYMGCIPIVKNRVFTQMFSRYFPILVIKNWGEISLDFLKKWYSVFEKINFIKKYNSLDFNFWGKVIEGKVKIQ